MKDDRRYVVAAEGQYAPNSYVTARQGAYTSLLDTPDPDVPKVAAFDGYTAHQLSRTAEFMGGLVRMGSPGTEAVATPAPITPYQPNVKATRPSFAAEEIHPTTSVALNLGVTRHHPGPARYAGARPEFKSEEWPQPVEMPWRGMRPQPVYPGRVTDWPRAVPRWLTFGETTGKPDA